MENLIIGRAVKFRRTDGRMQVAIITKINPRSGSITLEWCEQKETKGKVLDYKEILRFNPEFANYPNTTAIPQQKQPGTHTLVDTRYSGHGRHIRANGTLSSTTLGMTNNRLPTQCESNAESRFTAHNISRSISYTGLAKSVSNATADLYPQVCSAARRSAVINEIERLRVNRMERRARQAECKAQRLALKKTGHPNWETYLMIVEFQRSLHFNPLSEVIPLQNHRICVCVRKRPLSKKEIANKEIDIMSVPCKDVLIVHEPRNKVDLTKYLEHHKMRFDYVFDVDCQNDIVYQYTAKPLVRTIFEGGMATCFAYGQTGSGKTHTLGGEFHGDMQNSRNGICALATKDVFQYLRSGEYKHMNLSVSASFFEIYSGRVYDLLSEKQKLNILEDGHQQIQIVGLTEEQVNNENDVLRLLKLGNTGRTSGQTSANENSSRSHAIFQLVMRQGHSHKVHGKFSFIDLAGNERAADTSSSDRQLRHEGAEINKSLLALKECIRALAKQSSHLPFRVSKLTQVLRDSFIGKNSKTCMIAMVSPGLKDCENTLNTLRYADRVKELMIEETGIESETNQTSNSPTLYKTGQHPMQFTKSVDPVENMQAKYNEPPRSSKTIHPLTEISEMRRMESKAKQQHNGLQEYIAIFMRKSMDLIGKTTDSAYNAQEYINQSTRLFNELMETVSMCCDTMHEFQATLSQSK